MPAGFAITPIGIGDELKEAVAEIPDIMDKRFGARAEKSTVRRNGAVSPLPEPGIDPFWTLFFAGL